MVFGLLGRMVVVGWLVDRVGRMYSYGGGVGEYEGGGVFTRDEIDDMRRAVGVGDFERFRVVYLSRYPGEGEDRVLEEYEWWVEKVG